MARACHPAHVHRIALASTSSMMTTPGSSRPAAETSSGVRALDRAPQGERRALADV
ncbi:MAG: hypothetical protein U0V56_12515 [Actinomycetota bacterium]